MSTKDFIGRGTESNPPNRYEQLHVELDDRPPDEEDVAPETVFYRDSSRSILAENDSPDVGFRFSLNPYRGCEHGCVYCLGPETPVLHADMTWRPIGDVSVGDELVGFDEHPHPGRPRKFRRAVIEAVWWSRKPTVRLITERTQATTTANHRWLQARDSRWSRTDQLGPSHRLRFLPVVTPEPFDEDYRAGYLSGLSLADGRFRYDPGGRSDELGYPAAYWTLALADDERRLRVIDQLGALDVPAARRRFFGGPLARKPMHKVEIRALGSLAILHALLTVERDNRSYRRGFLAGFFDAEGASGRSLRISQVDVDVLARVQRYGRSLGFTFTVDYRPGRASALRLVGTVADRMRFFSVCRPAIARKVDAIFGREMKLADEPVHAVECTRAADVVDIQTSTGTFIAAGLATHNCYARPTHEYLGFSAGLDFERRIVVKDAAPELLRGTLRSARWTPQVVALSGNTDCYQPVERRLRLTRRCLEVFAEFRNPVATITKSSLVARDVDLYADLARDRAARVFVSVTTLDPELARRMEPRASRPEKRLEAIATLARAGVSVGVMIGPVIPGLNDAEIPRILGAAAAAGAEAASWVLLRLPKPLDRLFDRWLAERFPDRRDRVLNRIRETRSGRLSDARFGHRGRGEGEYATQIAALFAAAARKHGLDRPLPELSVAAFRRPTTRGDQLPLF